MPEHLNSTSSIESIAKAVSAVTHTPLVAVPVFLIISYYLLPINEFLITGIVSVFFGGFLPFILCYVWARKKNLEIDIPAREDRIYPLLMVIPSYLIGMILLYFYRKFCSNYRFDVLLFFNYHCSTPNQSSLEDQSAFYGYCRSFCLPDIRFRHSRLIFSLTIPLVMWSRVYLRKHTVPQVIMGALLGILLTVIQIRILLK